MNEALAVMIGLTFLYINIVVSLKSELNYYNMIANEQYNEIFLNKKKKKKRKNAKMKT